MKLYMMTTQDKYELPLAVADSVKELAQMTGYNAQRISEALSHRKNKDSKRKTAKNMRKIHPKWHKVIIDEV